MCSTEALWCQSSVKLRSVFEQGFPRPVVFWVWNHNQHVIAARVCLRIQQVRVLCRRGVIAGAYLTATGRWRIPDFAVEEYLAGRHNTDPYQAPTTKEFWRRLWMRYGDGRKEPPHGATSAA